MEVWNGIWNGRFLVWNGNGMEENCRYGIWKNRLPFHFIACPACMASRSRDYLFAIGFTGFLGYQLTDNKTFYPFEVEPYQKHKMLWRAAINENSSQRIFLSEPVLNKRCNSARHFSPT